MAAPGPGDTTSNSASWNIEFTLSAPACAADLAQPFELLDIFDVLAYLALFDASDPAADLAEPFNTFDIFDVLAYLALFDAGC